MTVGLVAPVAGETFAESETTATTLPKLGNSAEADRLMLREVTDQHIYDPAGATGTIHRQPGGAAHQHKPLSMSAWNTVKQSMRLTMPDHPSITRYREQYYDEALWVSRILHRANPFIGHVVDELDKRYLPVELALLPAIESGYRPDVVSSQDAAGIWQIIPDTAEDIGVTTTPWFDGRSDIRQSTRAAIDYLSYLNAEFHGDWALTLAAYNAGLGRVRAAIKRNKAMGLATDFWSLRLPSETRDYVPKFYALVALLRHDSPAELDIADVPRGTAFDIVDARRRVSLDRLALLTDLPESRLRHLNAGLVHGITPPDGPHVLYVPQGYGNPLISELVGYSASELYTPPETHVVAPGDSLSSLSRRYGISIKQLMEWNTLTSDLIQIGQKLTVMGTSEPARGVEYVVTIGDTLSAIAHRFGIPVNHVRDEQGLALQSDVIHPGEKLLLFINKTLE